MRTHKTLRPQRKAAPKKAYAPPVLVAWGTLREMTRHVGKLGKSDGGKTKNMTKTR